MSRTDKDRPYDLKVAEAFGVKDHNHGELRAVGPYEPAQSVWRRVGHDHNKRRSMSRVTRERMCHCPCCYPAMLRRRGAERAVAIQEGLDDYREYRDMVAVEQDGLGKSAEFGF